MRKLLAGTILATMTFAGCGVESSTGDGPGVPADSPEGGGSATEDAKITECATADENEFLGARAVVEFTNSGDSSRTYFATVNFESADGSELYDTGTASINGLGPGQSAKVEAQTFGDTLPEGTICKLAEVSSF